MKIFFFFFAVFFFLNSLSQEISKVFVGVEKPIKKIVSDNLVIPGVIMANESVNITTVVSEKIKRINFEEGKFVKKGDLLVELVDFEEKAILAQYTAELEEAEINYQRALQLSKKGNISNSLLENRLMKKKKLAAKINEITAKINDLKIVAPFDGFIGLKNFSEGSLVQPGEAITNLNDIGTLKIKANIPEIYFSRVKEKDSFTSELYIENKIEIEGKIMAVERLIDQETRTFKILGSIKNYKNKIKPGMMVKLDIPLPSKESLVINEGAIVNVDDLTFVYVIDENNTTSSIRVKIGLRKDGMVEILDGLTMNELVVVEGVNKIKNGSTVKYQ